MRRRVVFLVTALVIVGCAPTAPVPGAGPSVEPVAISPQVLGTLIEQHFGAAYALAGSDSGRLAVRPTEWMQGITATAYYRARPGIPERAVTVTFSPQPAGRIDCPPATCAERNGTYVRTPRTGTPDVVSPRETGLVQVQFDPTGWTEELLTRAVALAADPRIVPLTDAGLAETAAANSRWRTDDLDCSGAHAAGVVPLPAMSGSVEPPTPQSLAAVIASHIATGCVGGRTEDGLVEATAYLGTDTERISLAVTDQEPRCDQLDSCHTRDHIRIGWALDVEDGYPAMVRLVRRSTDGYWIVVEQHSLIAATEEHRFPIPLDSLLDLVKDQRIAPRVDAALNQAGDTLPLRWRLVPHTLE